MQTKLLVLAVSVLTLGAVGCGGGASNKCAGVTCNTGQTCDATTGSCVGGTGGGSAAGGSGGNGGGSGGGTATGGSGGNGGGTHAGGGTAAGGGSAGGGSAGGGSATGGGSAGGGIGGGDPLAGGETCAMATTIATAGTITATTMGLVDNYDFADSDTVGCQGSNEPGAADAVFKISVPAGQRLTVTVSPDTNWDPTLNLIAEPVTNCGTSPGDGGTTAGVICVGASDQGSGGDPETALYTNLGTAAQDVYILIDGYGSTDVGAFHLVTSVAAPPAGDTCSSATAITTAMTLSAETLIGFANDYTSNPGSCNFGSGPDRVYSISVPAGMRLTATATSTVGSLHLNLIDGPLSNCLTPTACLAFNESGEDAQPATARYINTAGAAHVVYAVVSEAGDPVSGETFSFVVGFDTPAAGDSCGTAVAVTTTLPTESFTGDVNDFSAQAVGCDFGSGPDRVYSITVPALNSATLNAVATMMGDLTLNAIDGNVAACTVPTYCVAGADNGGSGDPETITVNNTTNASKVIYAIVSEYSDPPPTGETYSLGVTFASIPAPPAGDTCATATAISAGTLTLQTTTGFYNDYQNDSTTIMCGDTFSAPGNDRVYSISVPAGKTLTVTVHPTGASAADENAVIYIMPSVASCTTLLSACLTGADMGVEGDDEVATYMNAGASAQTALIIVDNYNLGALPEFSLTTAIQ